jgi:hypothetical protein
VIWWEPLGARRGCDFVSGTARGATRGATPGAFCRSASAGKSGAKLSLMSAAVGFTRPTSSVSWFVRSTGRLLVNRISPTLSLVEPCRMSLSDTMGLRRVTKNWARRALIRAGAAVFRRKGGMDMKSPRSGARHPEFSNFVESSSASSGGLILAPIGFCSVQC